jgi:hypothetical protein
MPRNNTKELLASLEEEPISAGSVWDPVPLEPRPRPPRPQPQNSDAPFSVGDRDSYGNRQAIPPFRWPNPGQLMTPEIEYAERMYFSGQWMRGVHALGSTIRFRADELTGRTSGFSDYESMKAENWGFLVGLWAVHNIQQPSEETIDGWARAYADEHLDLWRKKK